MEHKITGITLEKPEAETEEVEVRTTKTVAPITLDGAYRLAQAILIDAHDSYVSSLKTIQKHRVAYESGLKEKVEKYLHYRTEKKKYEKIKSKNFRKRTVAEKMFLTEFKKHKPVSCDPKEIKIYNDYSNAIREKNGCEIFYKSKQFQLYCNGRFKGTEIITTLRKKAGYTYVD